MKSTRNWFSKFLRRCGHEVILAADGASGVKAAQGCIPNLILMDLNLPEVDGWEALRSIKAIPETSHIGIIALTRTGSPAMLKKRSRWASTPTRRNR
jgi:CheY-like chemotaxis protein